MYNALWDAVYAHTESVRAEAILAAVHRLLVREGGEKAIVIAAAMLATAPKHERQALLDAHVQPDYHAEIHGILEHDPGAQDKRMAEANEGGGGQKRAPTPAELEAAMPMALANCWAFMPRNFPVAIAAPNGPTALVGWKPRCRRSGAQARARQIFVS